MQLASLRKACIPFLVAAMALAAWEGLGAQPAEDGEQVPAPPVVEEESPLLVEPRSAEDFFDAAVLMQRLARPTLARRYLEGFAGTEPDDALLMRMREKHGPAIFLRLSNVPELRPLSTNLLNRVNEILRTQTEDPRYIDALIDDLFTSPQERRDALRALQNIGAPAVPRLLRRLPGTDAVRESELITAIVAIGEPAIQPLAAALNAPGDRLRSAAIIALGQIGSQQAVPYLWYPAFAEEQPAGVRAASRQALARLLKTPETRIPQLTATGVAAQLKQQASEHLRNEYPWSVGPDNQVAVWTWIPEQETVGLVPMHPEAASLYTGARLARQALALAPVKAEMQALFLALALGSEAYAAGWDQPLPTGPGTAYNLALTAGAEAVSAALALSLNSGNAAAAVAALRVLGQIATRDQLYKRGPAEAPIIAALSYPNDRVQFAAAATVLQLDPERAIPGAHRIVHVLARALVSGGSRRAVVIDPSVERAAATAALLRELGYEADIAPTGRHGFELAADRMDVELITIHLTTPQWPLSQAVANFRADARTAHIPIAVIGPDGFESRAATVLRTYPVMTYVSESTTHEHLEIQLRPFLGRLQAPLSPEQRRARQTTAAYWLAHLSSGLRATIYDLRAAEDALLEVLLTPELSRNTIVALGAIPSAAAQQALQQVAVTPQTPIETAEIAALQLAFHIQRFGLLLEREQVAELNAAWQAATDPQLSTALASVIGSMQPNARLVAERLQAFPPPALVLP